MITVTTDFKEVNDKLQSATSFIANSLEIYLDAQTETLEAYVNENNQRIWATKGSNIGANWQGKELVNSGALRASMTSVQLVRVGETLYWSSDLDYAQYVDEKFTIYGADEVLLDRITSGYREFIVNGWNSIWRS
jgi:hypothetical protein